MPRAFYQRTCLPGLELRVTSVTKRRIGAMLAIAERDRFLLVDRHFLWRKTRTFVAAIAKWLMT